LEALGGLYRVRAWPGRQTAITTALSNPQLIKLPLLSFIPTKCHWCRSWILQIQLHA
jgi:hypothetical protein